MTIKRALFLGVIVLGVIVASCTDTFLGPDADAPHPVVHPRRLATILDSLRCAANLPALACAIVTDTGEAATEAVGSRRYGGPVNVTVDDQFHLGSNTKAITAVLLAEYVDAGALTWSTTLQDIFPDLVSSMRSEYRTVTIREILSHSAGFVRDPSLRLNTATTREQRIETIVWAFGQPPATPRGSYAYSNIDYILAGAIIERLAGRPYEELLIERVMQPLGITTAGFGPMGTPGKEDQPLQHTPARAPIIPELQSDNHPIYGPAGRLHMSVGDWGRYIRWVLACEAGHGSLLRPETARMLTTPVVATGYGTSYAMGWEVTQRDWAGGRALTHGGSNGLNYSIAWLAPDRRFAVIAMTNICADDTPVRMDAVIGRLIAYYNTGN